MLIWINRSEFSLVYLFSLIFFDLLIWSITMVAAHTHWYIKILSLSQNVILEETLVVYGHERTSRALCNFYGQIPLRNGYVL